MAHFKKLSLLFFLFVFALDISYSALAQRQEIRTPYFSPDESVFSLSLNDVSRIALQNNFDVQLAKYDAEIERTGEGVAVSIYDTIIEAEANYRKDKSARTNTFAGTQNDENNYNVSASKKLPTGTTITVDFLNNKTKTDSAFATVNPAYDSSLGVTVEQDLGRNFFGLNDRGAIKITRLDIENSDYTSLEKIEGSIAEVQTAYWDLKLEMAREEVERRMLEQAKKLYDLHIEKIKDGLVEQPEILASEANYRERINAHLAVVNQVKTKQNVLKFLLNIPTEDIAINPAEAFDVDGVTPALELSLKEAFDNRRDYKKAHNVIKSKKINLAMKKNDLWPEVNLEASFSRNGISDQYDQSFNRIGQEDNPDIFTGISINFPLENTKARSKLKAAKLEKARALVNLKLVERRISLDVIDTVRTCNVLKEIAVNAENVLRLQKEKLKEEAKRFVYGRSDTDTLIRFQEDVIQAEDKALRAKFNYLTALIDLKKKEGTLLNSVWEEVL